MISNENVVKEQNLSNENVEIKEILDYLGNDKNYNCDCNDGSYYLELPYREAYELKDYITNLQQDIENYVKITLSDRNEIKNLMHEIKRLRDTTKSQTFCLDEGEHVKLKAKIDKAIGIANERINYCYQENDKDQLESWQEIFDILQGSEKRVNDKIYPTMVIRSQAEAIQLLEKENERLNNIINELEKYLNEQVDYMTHLSIERMVAFDCCRHKLQELKGDSSNEN